MVPQGPGKRNWGMAEGHPKAGAWGHHLDDGHGLLCEDPVLGQLLLATVFFSPTLVGVRILVMLLRMQTPLMWLWVGMDEGGIFPPPLSNLLHLVRRTIILHFCFPPLVLFLRC